MTNHGGGCQPSSTGWQTGPKANLIRLQWAEIQIQLWCSSIVAAAEPCTAVWDTVYPPPSSIQDLRPLGGAQRSWWNSANFTKNKIQSEKNWIAISSPKLFLVVYCSQSDFLFFICIFILAMQCVGSDLCWKQRRTVRRNTVVATVEFQLKEKYARTCGFSFLI